MALKKQDMTGNLRKNTRAMNNSKNQQKQNELQEQNDPQEQNELQERNKPQTSDHHTNSKNISQSGRKKVGRPKVKTEPEKTINIAIPVSMLEKMNVAKLKYKNNLTRYVNAIIKEDLEKNFEEYLKIQEYIK